MKEKIEISDLIQYHNGIEKFNYDIAVDWAIELIEKGIETDNILMLASFAKPVDSAEIKPYVNAVLTDLNIVEKEGNDAIFSLINFYLSDIISNNSIRYNLNLLYDLFIEMDCINDDKFGLMPFYLLYHGWGELEDMGCNFYTSGQSKNEIIEELKNAAKEWINKHITK